ncbi:hypothetical protein BD311DRAFT_702198 [Dichomitus squalens]|uniref:BRCT domain-containing protein n=1 Tax=Dichomitus squalens TaxID=114155 RepID=A0A4Q9MAT6_9APHY|nr:hypothetical protein BD311DRAFT_702198 [Dichomitus squalens]
MPKTIFDGVYYYISETIPLEKRDQLSEVLDVRGGTPVPVADPRLTHFITTSLPLEEFVESLPEDSPAHTVTPFWVERSAVLDSTQDPEYYYADPAFLFSGVVAAATDLSKSDCELISAAVTALGGQWRTALTRDVTHLFALAPGSAKYETAMHYREQTGVRVLVPHWFDDTVRLGIRDLPTRHYEWPEPRVFQQRPEGRTTQEDEDYEPPSERMMLYETASMSNDEQRKVRPASRNVWKGKKLLLGLSLDLSEHQRKALYADIRRQGGEVVELSSPKSVKAADRAQEEVAKIDEADIFVTRYRTGAAYAKAYQQKKTIGTLAWLWYVRATGTLTRPADQLLHYPIPDKPSDGFDKEVVTVTNYTGKDREYLKKLITLMGGEFTASMSAEHNTIVVAAYLHGTKTDKATSWSIPIVNHTWVEDCFVQWRRLTPAREKYIVFPPGVDFSTVLAERGIGRISWEPGQLEDMQRASEAGADEDVEMHEEAGEQGATPRRSRRKSKSASASPAKVKKKRRAEQDNDEEGEGGVLHGTAQSAGEVEEAVAMDENEGEVSVGAQMDVDASFSDLKPKGRRQARDEMDIDGDEEEDAGAGPSQSPVTKRDPPTKRPAPEKEAATKVPAKRKLVRRYTPRKTDDEAEPDEDAEDVTPPRDAVTTPSPVKRHAKTYGSAKAKRVQRERDDDAQTESPSPVKKPQSTRWKAAPADEDVATVEESSDDQLPVAKTRARAKKQEARKPVNTRAAKSKEKAKAKEQPAAQSKKHKLLELSSDSESESTEEDIRSVLGDLLPNGKGKARAGATSPTKVGRTPQRLDSVLVPTVAEVYGSPARQSGKVSPQKVGPSKKTAKSAPADEDEDAAPARGGKTKKPTRAAAPSESGRSEPPPPAATKAGRKSSSIENAEAGPSRASTSTLASPEKMTRTPSKRSAATKATRKLHDVIMPDVVSFQKEMKRGAVRASREGTADAKDSAKTPAPARGGKKRRSIGSEGVRSEEDDDEMPERKKQKPNEVEDAAKGAAKGKKKAGRKSAAAGLEESPPAKEPGTSTTTNNEAAATKDVRVMTTQLTLSEDVLRGLTKLGVKIVTKPTECTHLLVKSVVRTEKFLCAMAVAPYVLSEKWAVMSAANKKLLPEADYAIKDETTENKYSFSLDDALKRAKQNAGKLFRGITFYITPKVSVETKLLKNVVTANGGQVSTQTPTVRILAGHGNRFVISCPEDVSIWRPLAQHHKIYTQELILTSALRQRIDWDDTAFQVPASW